MGFILSQNTFNTSLFLWQKLITELPSSALIQLRALGSSVFIIWNYIDNFLALILRLAHQCNSTASLEIVAIQSTGEKKNSRTIFNKLTLQIDFGINTNSFPKSTLCCGRNIFICRIRILDVIFFLCVCRDLSISCYQ